MTYDSTKDMFYGATSAHGATGGGTIFVFNPQTNAETVVHSFGTGSGDGTGTLAAFTYDPANGMFYGTTPGRGAGSNGRIFKFKP